MPSYTDTGKTGTYIGGAPILGPMYNPPGGGKPVPLSEWNPSDPGNTGNYTFNPATGLNAAGLTAGQQAAKDYQQNTSLVNTTKSQPIQSSIDTTLSNENTLQAGTVNAFNQYLAQAQKQMQDEQGAITTDRATMNNLPAQLSTELSNAVTQFANTGNQINQNLTNLNAANANTVNTNIAQLATLDDQSYAAQQAAAQKAVADAQAQQAARYSASGTPTSGSGYQQTIAANTEAGIMLPVTAANYQNRIGQLENYISPQQQQLYSQQVAQLTGLELPLAQQLVNLGVTNSSQVAQLQAALAGRTLSEQIQFFQQLGVPVQMAQQLAQSLPSAIGQLSATNLSNNMYGLAQNYQQPLPGGLPTYGAPMPGTGGTRSYTPPGAGGFVTAGPVTAGATPLPATVGAAPVSGTAPAGGAYPMTATPYSSAPGAPTYNMTPYGIPELANDAANAYMQPMFNLSGPSQYSQ